MTERFSRGERLLIAIGLALLLVFGALFFSGMSIHGRILGWDVSDQGKKVGVLSQSGGETRRKAKASTDFQEVGLQSEVFNEDTIVTSPSGGAQVQLDDGTTIELGPSTMVKLVFDTDVSLQGIFRKASVEVVTGKVTGTSSSGRVVLKNRKEVVRLDDSKAKVVVAQKILPLPTVAPVAQPAVSIPVPEPVVQAPPPAPEPTPVPVAIEPPAPPPVVVPKLPPAKVVYLAPNSGAVVKLDAFPKTLKASVEIRWSSSIPDLQAQVLIREAGEAGEVLIKKPVVAVRGNGLFKALISKPGKYIWSLLPVEGAQWATPSKEVGFTVAPEFEGIQLIPPLIGDSEQTTNAFNGELKQSFEGITLRWQKPEHPRSSSPYSVKVFRKSTGNQTALSREMEEERYSFNKGKLLTGDVYYEVHARLKDGWVAKSKRDAFNFQFAAPRLVLPEAGASLAPEKPKEPLAALFTWERTNYTKGYEIEMASDQNFTKVVLKRQVVENFLLFKTPPAGEFWWRVRSYSDKVSSPYSVPRRISFRP